MIFVCCALIAAFNIQLISCGQQCMSCSGVQGESGCQHFTDCFDNEVCYMHSYSEEGVVRYDYGCGAQQTCFSIDEPLIGRRSDNLHAICTKCCNGTRLCNSRLQCNDQQIIPKNQQCMSCRGVSTGMECHHFLDCYDNEICYMHSYRTNNGSVLFNFGCGATQNCQRSTRSSSDEQLDEHHALCTECCHDSSLCNRDLQCGDTPHFSAATVAPTTSYRRLARECSDIKIQNPALTSGVYTIYPFNTTASNTSVFCKFDSNGNWTVIQRRIDGNVDFYRSWNAYKHGFGYSIGEYWIGNDNLHALTSYANHTLRVELEDFNNVTKYAEYAVFYVADESEKYRLTVTNYSGDAGDSLYRCRDGDYGNANGMKFSTFDKDNDNYTARSCARDTHGAWWYNVCSCANVNNRYTDDPTERSGDLVGWLTFLGYYNIPLKSVIMLIK